MKSRVPPAISLERAMGLELPAVAHAVPPTAWGDSPPGPRECCCELAHGMQPGRQSPQQSPFSLDVLDFSPVLMEPNADVPS
jgi:hypothetical protein